MPEKDEIQTEQEGQKELTVDDLETVAGGEAVDLVGSEIGEVGGPNGARDVKSD